MNDNSLLKFGGPETCDKCGLLMYYGKDDHKCTAESQSTDLVPVEVPRVKSYFEELEEEADKYGGKYASTLYPKFMLGAYHYVHNGKWSYGKGGHPETFIDQHLGEWVKQLTGRDAYVDLLAAAVASDPILLKMLCLNELCFNDW